VTTTARPPVPRAAHRLVMFVLDAARCAAPADRAQINAAINATIADLTAGPGGDDHQFAAVVYGDDLARVHPVGASRPWDLDVPCRSRPRIDGACVALADLAAGYLDAAVGGLPATVDVLVLADPADRSGLVRPDDSRVIVAWVDDLTDLADIWWDRLTVMRSSRRHTVLLR
jgi:hypothetical protein